MAEDIYQKLQELAAEGQTVGAIDTLIQHFEAEQQYHELFEALKMKLRASLGLNPAQAEREESLDEEREVQLERGLLDACRTVGQRLLELGKVREGWMYLRPVGDKEFAAEAMRAVETNDENVDELMEVLLHEGVDVGRGYALSLEKMGTCNSITLFESALAARPREDQQIAAELLVRHVHEELIGNLKRDIEQREEKPVEGRTAEELLKGREDLLRDGSYHLDTSHIASTVRFARVLDKPEVLRLALDISIYGRQLHPQYQYPGEEPFLDLYPASCAFFRALLGQQVESGIRYFVQKADSVDQNQFGTVAVEVLIDLLSRCGKQQEALEAYRKRLTPESRLVGIAPSLLQLSQRLGQYDAMRDICQERDDLLGFAAAALQSQK